MDLVVEVAMEKLSGLMDDENMDVLNAAETGGS